MRDNNGYLFGIAAVLVIVGGLSFTWYKYNLCLDQGLAKQFCVVNTFFR